MKRIIRLLVITMLISGCASISQVTAPNRTNLLKLSLGMSKEETIKVMGDKAVNAYYMGGIYGGGNKSITINNPYRSEILQGKDKVLEVIYYVTDVKRDDGAISDDELTPLVFENGKLTGWGWSFLNDNIQKYEIRVR